LGTPWPAMADDSDERRPILGRRSSGPQKKTPQRRTALNILFAFGPCHHYVPNRGLHKVQEAAAQAARRRSLAQSPIPKSYEKNDSVAETRTGAVAVIVFGELYLFNCRSLSRAFRIYQVHPYQGAQRVFRLTRKFHDRGMHLIPPKKNLAADLRGKHG
jgi:hypothetical protein